MAATFSKVTNKISRKRYLCGTPTDHCSGSMTKCSNHMKATKTHVSSVEAFKCHAKYLINVEGYQQIGSREFAAPNNGPIRVLTKKSRFGAMLRGGKEGRSMPKAFVGGTLVSM